MQCNSSYHWFRLTVLIIFVSFLSGCGTGDGEETITDPIFTGFLIDSPVEGVSYRTDTISGITDTQGAFDYNIGETVTFSIGDIDLGTADARGVLTPVQLTGSANATDQAAKNMLVFLQSIDADMDPLTGITITSAFRQNAIGLSLDFSDPGFTAAAETAVAQITGVSPAVLVSEVDALANFQASYTDGGGAETFGFNFFPIIDFLANGGFEAPDASGGPVGCSSGSLGSSWSCFNDTLIIDSADARTGSQILQQFNNDGGAFQDIEAVPGEEYTASVWARNDSDDALNRRVLVALQFYNSSDVLVGATDVFGTPSTDDTVGTYLEPDTWVELSAQGFAPADAVTARILLLHLSGTGNVFAPGGSIFWDDASITGPDTTAGLADTYTSGGVFYENVGDQWTNSIAAFDQALSFNNCTDDDGAGCPSVNWSVTAAADTSRGDVIDVVYDGAAQFAGMIIGQTDVPNSEVLDLSSFAGGNIVFDLNVIANPSSAAFTMKVDCLGCPTDAGQREQSLGVPAAGWQTISVPIDDLVNANGGPTVGGLKLDQVTTGLVLFPAFGSTAGVEYQLDNVRWERPGAVFEDVVADPWVNSIAAFDQALGFSNCTDDDGAGCPSVNWSVTAAADTSRVNVIDVVYSGTAQFAGMIIGQTTTGRDLTSFAGGNLIFDLNVTANPSNAAFTMKVDCVGCPTNAGEREQPLGVPGSGWQTFTVPIDDMVNANGGPTVGGLKLDQVTTGLVLFPAFGSTAGVEYQLDNVRWEGP